MKNAWSTAWKASSQPRKQRKYQYNAPLHIRRKFLGSPLSKELREKHKTRTMQIHTGDKVKILRGQYRGQTSKVESVDAKMTKVMLSGITLQRKDGTKVQVRFDPSNLQITELKLDDKRRNEILQRRA